ncbi:metallophosphoesterase [Candidatus Woesearchaeota archaeon]|nr:metallophosphoesterase [Candidatus Woesearchaeota archaeon]
MQLTPGISAHDLVLFLESFKTAIIADLHLGYEEALKFEGVLVPRFLCKDLMKRIEPVLVKLKPKRVVINGDFKHEFGTVMKQEWRDTLRFIDFLSRHCGEIVIVKGNHDVFLGAIASRRNVRVEKELWLGDILVAHGDELPVTSPKPKIIIIGHEHPAVTLRSGVRAEKYKCFLVGKWKRSVLIVQPSCNLATEGTDVLRSELLSPFLQRDISEFQVFVVDEKAQELLAFGAIHQLE